MTTHIICDKCSKEVECTEKTRAVHGTIKLTWVSSENTTFLDLCEPCYHKVVKFIKDDGHD